MNITKILTDLQQKYNAYSKTHGNTKLLDNTGFFKNGKVISKFEFERRYRRRLNYGIAIAQDIISPEFELKKIQKLKDSIIEMLYHMGNSQLAVEIEKLNLNEFQKVYESGSLDNVISLYDDYVSTELIEIFAGKQNRFRQKKYRLRKKVKLLLGYE